MTTKTKGGAFDVARSLVQLCDAEIQSASLEASLAGEAENANGLRGLTGSMVAKLERALQLARSADGVADLAQRDLRAELRAGGRRAALEDEGAPADAGTRETLGALGSVVLRTLDVSETAGRVEEWRGTLAELVDGNPGDLEVLNTATEVARDGVAREIGGGASARTAIERVNATTPAPTAKGR